MELPVLDVEKAIKVLQDYIKELEEQKPEELTDRQAMALVKFTQELISPADTETQSASNRKIKEISEYPLEFVSIL